LRFLAATLGGWALLRTGMLWPTLEAARDLAEGLSVPAAIAAVPAEAAIASPRPAALAAVLRSPAAAPPAAPRPRNLTHIALGAASFLSFGRAIPIEEDEEKEGAVPPPLRPTPVSPTARLTGSAWGILREGVATGLPGGQLGGSQAGVRIAYGLGARQRAALTARVSAPLEGRGAEAAFGVELRPAVLPIRVFAERRVGLDGGRGATALYAVGGVDPTRIGAGFRLEAYAQGGVVIRGEAQGFADGAARVTRPVSRAIDLGVGAWGGTQPGVSRVDVGPTIGVALPVARRSVRLSIDWRQRVAGQARPGSGPALSIGSDF
jgi:hypothetical protein